MWESLAKFIARHAIAVIAFWILLASAGNLLLPQVESIARTHARAFLPQSAPVNVASGAMGRQFHDGTGGNVNYLVLESDHELGPRAHQFYDGLLARLRSDPTHVESAMDLWSHPATSQAAQSGDNKSAYTMLRLPGDLGTARANEAVAAVRQAVAEAQPPAGLQVYVTGPGATVADLLTAIDKQMLLITAVTVVLIASLLWMVYRSVITANIPLLTVGLALGVTRPAVALLGRSNIVNVSIFSVSLLGALVLGATTDYGIFLLGRYHEQRRSGIDHEKALSSAYRGVAPVVTASALTIAVALSFLRLGHTGTLRSAGWPCALGILIGMTASLTLSPALLALAGRYGLAQPRALTRPAGQRWSTVGTIVARWPGPVLVCSTLVLVLCAVPALTARLNFDEIGSQPATTPANRGYQAMDRHFPPNRLLPEIVFIHSDHDLRNSSGAIAVEQISRKIMAIPGVPMVQSASRPNGTVPDQATLTTQAGMIADRLDRAADKMNSRLAVMDDLSSAVNGMSSATSELHTALATGSRGIAGIESGIMVVQSGMTRLQNNVNEVSQYVDPLRQYTESTPNCISDSVCSMVLKVVQPLDSVAAATTLINNGTSSLGSSTQKIAKTFDGTESSVGTMTPILDQLTTVTAQMKTAVSDARNMFSGLTDYLHSMRQDFRNSAEGGFYLPPQAWDDGRVQQAMAFYFSPDGHSTRILVYGDGKVLSPSGATRSHQILAATKEATKEGSLRGSTADITGFGTAVGDTKHYVNDDFMLLSCVALAMVFLIVFVMLRSPVAAAVVIGTVAASYASALGVTTLLWQDLAGHDLYWAVPSIALIALVAVGADYNLLLTMRLREEVFVHGSGMRTGIIRAFRGTGAVVTVAGVVFGVTMFALLSSDVLSIEQVGTTIGVGLIIDTLIVRSFVVPALAGLLGRWFWWSPGPLAKAVLSHWGLSRRSA